MLNVTPTLAVNHRDVMWRQVEPGGRAGAADEARGGLPPHRHRHQLWPAPLRQVSRVFCLSLSLTYCFGIG